MNTGMRQREQFSLLWSQVNLKERTIQLHKTKNGQARKVMLNDAALAALTSHKGEGKPKPSDKVWDYPDGYRPRKWWESAQKKAGITRMVWHSAGRHTFASMLAESKSSAVEIQRALGHTTITMASRYVHLGDEHMRTVVNRVSFGK